ncbi:MAG TPA: hypothetical protein VFS33_08140 [Gemmatimonadales bacterium]|nr:hypothetical protein [Gemmatimonadales bacterium]
MSTRVIYQRHLMLESDRRVAITASAPSGGRVPYVLTVEEERRSPASSDPSDWHSSAAPVRVPATLTGAFLELQRNVLLRAIQITTLAPIEPTAP